MYNSNNGRSSKAVLMIVMLLGLILLGWGKLDNLANAGAFALIYIGAILNRLDSRGKNYKASITAGGVTANLESTGLEEDEDPLPVQRYRAKCAKAEPDEDDEPGQGSPANA